MTPVPDDAPSDGPADAGEADALALSPDDNVATVLRPVGAGECLRVRRGDAVLEVEAREAIPLCHKMSLAPIAAGGVVMKYGQPIGEASAPVEPGRHVHVHNMRSARARARA